MQKIARRHSLSTDYVLRRYAAERLMYRISLSSVRDSVVLKGGSLFMVWIKDIALARPTMDTDFLFRNAVSEQMLRDVFNEICSIRYDDDAVVFDVGTLRVRDIRAKNVYGGFEVSLTARLGKTRIPVQIDIGIGDCVTPMSERTAFPKILDELEEALLLTYPKESVIAEKFEAMISIGLINSRMKDFYDVWFLLSHECPVL